MASEKKPRADAKLKGLPDAEQEMLWRMLHPQDPEVKPQTLEDLQVHCMSRHGWDTLSLSTLSEWRSWYALRRRMENAQARAGQAKLEWLKENPDATPEELERLGQMVFTAESIEAGNVKGFVALMRERSRRQALELDRDKLTAASRSKIEAGLDALFGEIKGNAKAEKIFAQLKQEVAK